MKPMNAIFEAHTMVVKPEHKVPWNDLEPSTIVRPEWVTTPIDASLLVCHSQYASTTKIEVHRDQETTAAIPVQMVATTKIVSAIPTSSERESTATRRCKHHNCNYFSTPFSDEWLIMQTLTLFLETLDFCNYALWYCGNRINTYNNSTWIAAKSANEHKYNRTNPTVMVDLFLLVSRVCIDLSVHVCDAVFLFSEFMYGGFKKNYFTLRNKTPILTNKRPLSRTVFAYMWMWLVICSQPM